MASQLRPPSRLRRRLVSLIVCAVAALIISIVGAWLVVVSQNPASHVTGPSTLYGPVS